MSNGCRVYDDRNAQRIHSIQLLQAGGLTLKECKSCLEAKIDKELLQKRLKQLVEEIESKQQSRQLLAAMLGDGTLGSWHEMAGRLAPKVHQDWQIWVNGLLVESKNERHPYYMFQEGL